MEFDNTDSAQCYDILSKVNSPDIKLIYDIIIVYYFFVILISHNKIKSDLKNLIISFGRQLDKSPETESQEEKTESVLYAFEVGFKTLGTLIYMMFGFYIKTWLILTIHPSLRNIITIFGNEQVENNTLYYYNNYVISGASVYLIISNLYDKSIVKINKLVSILSVCKDLGIGLIIFMHESQISELMKYSFNLSIKIEIISYLIMIVII